MFEASLLSEGTEGYGDARSRALYSQIMLHTYPRGYGEGLSSEQISDVATAATKIGSQLFSAFAGGAKAKKEAEAAAAASAAAERQARAEAALEAERAKTAAAEGAVAQKRLLVFGGLGVVALLVGGGLIYTMRKQK